jgi:hypothetical protein
MSAGVRRRVTRLERVMPAHLCGAERRIAVHRLAAMALPKAEFEAVIADLEASLVDESDTSVAPHESAAEVPFDRGGSDSGGEPSFPFGGGATEVAPSTAPDRPADEPVPTAAPKPMEVPREIPDLSDPRLSWMEHVNKPPNGPRPPPPPPYRDPLDDPFGMYE